MLAPLLPPVAPAVAVSRPNWHDPPAGLLRMASRVCLGSGTDTAFTNRPNVDRARTTRCSSMRQWRLGIASGALGLFMLSQACGGSDSPTQPSPPTGGGTPPAATATITITSSGVSPSAVTVGVGGTVTFVNNDSVAHNMSSNPHPQHTDCPALTVGSVPAGASRTSQPLTTARSCGFHDHDNPETAALQGTVTIR
jgi:plastocyanin